jgi:tryptophanyl-tRNA synthetase
MNKPVLVSGIQPTGRLHLGNYLGALKNFVDLQNSGKYQCFFFIADLHALTEEFKPTNLKKNVLDLAASFLAAGLEAQKSVIFVQSELPQHTELAWILANLTPVGELKRMTQFKEKTSAESQQSPNTGLLTYPILMAADILLYNAQFVPVGEDQLQHLELTRTLVRKFNNKFGKTFFEPQPLLTDVPRLMSLDNPRKKMSKSYPHGCLFLDDSPEVVKVKIRKAVTDSGREIIYDPKRKPAISNLMLIYAALNNWPVKTVQVRFRNANYIDFKERLGELVVRYFEAFRKKKKEVMSNVSFLATLANGTNIARETAAQKLIEVKKKIGLLL